MRTRLAIAMVVVLAGSAAARAAAPGQASAPASGANELAPTLPNLDSPGGVSGALKWIALLTVLSVAPAVIIMATCFTRIIVVLGLLRQALASPQLPPNQVLFALSLLMTVVIMAPVYSKVNSDALTPYSRGEITGAAAIEAGQKHVRGFMIDQIEACGNSDDVYLFLDERTAEKKTLTWGDVPTLSLLPAFVVSELKTAFLMGFRIYLPFLVIDMLVASSLVSMGMLMLPPVLISLPLKLLLFVLSDGWRLVVGTLMRSFT